MAKRRWVVKIDGEIERYATRAEAREAAAWHNRHPANIDIRRFGPHQNVDGIARVYDADAEEGPWWPPVGDDED